MTTTTTLSSSSSSSWRRCYWISACFLTCGALFSFVESPLSFISSAVLEGTVTAANTDFSTIVPQELLDHGIYNASDFENSIGIRPPFWESTNTNSNTSSSNDSSTSLQSWGPCYPPHTKVHWNYSRERGDEGGLEYMRNKKSNFRSVEGGCRPGFLIIGAGKCGTSSLYHYLVGHPRVVPAYEKQIHYFKYHTSKPLGWYYSWFPTTKTFLESGALMTGEASPGYLPYPEVVRQVKKSMPGPKIVCVGRNPLERTYSSYRYNYVEPTLDALHRGSVQGIPGKQDYEYYQQYLFSLEDFVKAELHHLNECVTGFGINATRNMWYDKTRWMRPEFDQRERMGLPPLIDLDHVCYGSRVNNTVLRPQWAEMQLANPEKIILSPNAFLVQALIGRSLYVFPLEWWYIQFDPSDVLFVCTEDLSNPDKLNQLTLQMGLPSFNFTDVIAEGAYNVGGHDGYDKATSWTVVETEEEKVVIPLSDDLRQEYLAFVQPINERLFALTGKRCNWD